MDHEFALELKRVETTSGAENEVNELLKKYQQQRQKLKVKLDIKKKHGTCSYKKNLCKYKKTDTNLQI